MENNNKAMKRFPRTSIRPADVPKAIIPRNQSGSISVVLHTRRPTTLMGGQTTRNSPDQWARIPILSESLGPGTYESGKVAGTFDSTIDSDLNPSTRDVVGMKNLKRRLKKIEKLQRKKESTGLLSTTEELLLQSETRRSTLKTLQTKFGTLEKRIHSKSAMSTPALRMAKLGERSIPKSPSTDSVNQNGKKRTRRAVSIAKSQPRALPVPTFWPTFYEEFAFTDAADKGGDSRTSSDSAIGATFNGRGIRGESRNLSQNRDATAGIFNLSTAAVSDARQRYAKEVQALQQWEEVHLKKFNRVLRQH